MKTGYLTAAMLVVACAAGCGVPDDGKSDVRGRVAIDAALTAAIVQPGPSADGDCAGQSGWGQTPSLGDTAPTLYVGIYAKALDPQDASTWQFQCGLIDDDNNPTTAPVQHYESCPVGGTTGLYHPPTAAEPWTFEFAIPYMSRGDFFLYAWLDNKCAAANGPTGNLVWDLGDGPPDGGDLIPAAAVPIRVGGGSVDLDVLLLDQTVTP